MSKPFAGAAHAGLNLVQNHQPVIGVAQGAHLLHVFGAHGVQAAFALNGLHHHAHDVGVAFGGFLQRFDIVGSNADKAIQQGTEAFAHLGLAVALMVPSERPWKAWS